MCPCDKAQESRTHIVGEYQMDKEERDVLEEDMRQIAECGIAVSYTHLTLPTKA